MKLFAFSLCSFLCAFTVTTATAAAPRKPKPTAEEPAPISKGTFSFYFENDLFAGTDRYYTSGVKLGWTSTNLEKIRRHALRQPTSPASRSAPFRQRSGLPEEPRVLLWPEHLHAG
jgi:hypothetical protein